MARTRYIDWIFYASRAESEKELVMSIGLHSLPFLVLSVALLTELTSSSPPQIAPQRCALEATKYKKERKSAAAAVDGFLEELVVRRELSDNFCHYEKR